MPLDQALASRGYGPASLRCPKVNTSGENAVRRAFRI